MSEIFSYQSESSQNNFIFKTPGKALREAGMVSALFVATVVTPTPSFDPIQNLKQVKVSSGVLTKNMNEPLLDEQKINQVALNVINPSEYEYANNKRTVTVLLNGSLLEGEYPMNHSKNFPNENENLIIGNLDFLGQIPVKKRIEVTENHSVKEKNVDFSELKSIAGDLEFMGHIPKKPRI
jgi:hypothetical protein